MTTKVLHPDFIRAFQSGAPFRLVDRYGEVREKYTVQTKHIADLVFTTGRIVACDPFVSSVDTEPFTVTVPAGTYPVILSVALVVPKDRRVACAKVQFHDSAPVRWEMALLPGQDPTTLQEGYTFGYDVDTGSGCFGDIEALHYLRLRQRNDQGRIYFDEVTGAMKANHHQWANITFAPDTQANCVMCSSGWGDGTYASWWGYDANNAIACLVTDFGVLPR
jgi:hypothetical protein